MNVLNQKKFIAFYVTVFIISFCGILIYELNQFNNVRLYNVVGLPILPGTHRQCIINLLGEPDAIEQIQVSDIWYVYEYYYNNQGLIFRLDSSGRTLGFNVMGTDFMLSGRDRLRVGSNRRNVERAVMRPTSSKLNQNFWIYKGESNIAVTIDKIYNVRFYFDEYNIIYMIRIYYWG